MEGHPFAPARPSGPGQSPAHTGAASAGPASSQRLPSSPGSALQASGLQVLSPISKSQEGRGPRTSLRPPGRLGTRSLDRGSHDVPGGLCNQSPLVLGRGGGPSLVRRPDPSRRVGKAAELPGPSNPGRPALRSPLAPLSSACWGSSGRPAQQSRQAARRGAMTGAGPGDGHSVAAASARHGRNK